MSGSPQVSGYLSGECLCVVSSYGAGQVPECPVLGLPKYLGI